MKCLYLFLFCMTTQVVDHVNSENILVIAFFSSKSHKLTYMPLIEELGKRGHNITIVSSVKPAKVMKNVKEIFTLDVQKLRFNAFEEKEKGTTFSFITYMNMIAKTCVLSYELPQVKDLLNEKFDLVFLQPMFNECVLGLIYRLQAPFVVFTPTAIPSFLMEKMGGHFPNSFTPNTLLRYPEEMTFYQRLSSFGIDMLMGAWRKFAYDTTMENIYRESLGHDIPSINEIFANASLALSNGHFSVTGPKPYFPDVIDVGGLHSKPAKPIPKDLEDFISKGKNGFVLFSMGSAIKGDMMPDSKRQLLLNVFSRLKQQVLWKWESESMPNLPKNVKLSKWLPQQDLLGHKDIKMFITHCGAGGIEESIYHGVPLVGLPMMADQPTNARVAKDKGFLVEVNWNDLTEETFEEAINEILTNPIYRDNVKQLSTLFRDRVQDPLELGIYWIEYVLRHKGAPHLRHAGRKINIIQYHSIDVIATYFAIIVTALYAIFAVLRFTCRKLLCRSLNTYKYNALAEGKKTN